jgi:hypothetical protein
MFLNFSRLRYMGMQLTPAARLIVNILPNTSGHCGSHGALAWLIFSSPSRFVFYLYFKKMLAYADHTRPIQAYWLIDRKGRRWLLLVTLPFMALFMLAAALGFLIPKDNNAHVIVIAVFTYCFIFFYSWVSLSPIHKYLAGLLMIPLHQGNGSRTIHLFS